MKFEPNWKFKSLDSLEKTNWGPHTYDSYLIKTVRRLGAVPLNEFQIEDLRIMIGQNIGLKFLIPLAIEQLSINLFAIGDCYKGDLLQMILNVEKDYWVNNKENWLETKKLINEHLEVLDSNKIKYSGFLKVFEPSNGK